MTNLIGNEESSEVEGFRRPKYSQMKAELSIDIWEAYVLGFT